MPTARIVKSYMYGQIHCDRLDTGGPPDRFTSGREGVIESDEIYQSLLSELRDRIIPQILKEWDHYVTRLVRGAMMKTNGKLPNNGTRIPYSTHLFANLKES